MNTKLVNVFLTVAVSDRCSAVELGEAVCSLVEGGGWKVLHWNAENSTDYPSFGSRIERERSLEAAS